VDISVLTWIVLGTFIKFYDAILMNEHVLYQRGGNIWGSNHVGGIILLLLPLIKSRLLKILSIIFLIFTFSKGIYLGLIIYGILWFFLISHKKTLNIILISCIIITICLTFLPAEFTNHITDFALMRIRLRGVNLSQSPGSILIKQALKDQRWSIWNSALKITKQTHWVGTGLGGFAWGLKNIGYPPIYSNAHSMYLTALAEGGLIFLIGLLCLLLYILRQSFKINKAIFIGIFVWVIYGLCSGQIYGAARFVSAGEYYYLMFILAYITYLHRIQHTLDNK